MAEKVARLDDEQWGVLKAALDGEIADLRAQVARLEGERDRWKGENIATQLNMAQVVGERDAAQAANAAKDAALRAVEWSYLIIEGIDDTPVGPMPRVVEHCPWCAVSRSAGHGSGCIVAAALSDTQTAGEGWLEVGEALDDFERWQDEHMAAEPGKVPACLGRGCPACKSAIATLRDALDKLRRE